MAPQHVSPESILPRSDSKNPATTCKGITSNGRPCRRALASSKSSPIAPLHTPGGVLAVYQDDHGHVDAAAFYCWQHKDQAQDLVNRIPPPGLKQAKIVPLQERNSIDSLAARLGIASMQEQPEPTHIRTDRHRHTKYDDQEKQRPARSLSSDMFDHYQQRSPRASSPELVPTPLKRSKRPGFWAALCCMSSSADDDDYLEVVRHKDRVQAPARRPETAQTSGPPAVPTHARHPTRSGNPLPRPAPTKTALPSRKPLSDLPIQPPNPRLPSTPNLLSYIPPHLSPITTSLLLAELSKPISPCDTPGYIYIFWLTSTTTTPSPTTAASLLTPPTPKNRRISDVLSAYSHTPDDDDDNDAATNKNSTIKLKIGRANNVHRRMNEWTRQCGHALSLVRWYPHVPSSTHTSPAASLGRYPDLSHHPPPPASSSSRPATVADRRVSDQSSVRKVLHAHRVERLIHLELAEKRVKRDCRACGREHREWFEIEATQEGIRAVDEVVRRWVGWAEARAGEI